MANQKKKKKKTNIDDIIQQMELDMMRAGKIPGEEGTSLVSQMQTRRRAQAIRNEWRPQGGAVIPLLPTSPLDLAFETLLTGMAHSEGVDPRIAIATGIAAGKVIPKLPAAARAINIKGGGALSRYQYKKGFEAAKKDPMFSDIDYAREVRFVGAKDKDMSDAMGWYSPSAGQARRHLELYPNQRKFPGEEGWAAPAKSISLREQTLGELLTLGRGKYPKVPQVFKPWAGSIIKHESRHYKQHVEGMKRLEDYTFGKTTYEGSKYGYAASGKKVEGAYSTLIRIPKPKNPWPGIPKKYIMEDGMPVLPLIVLKREIKKRGKKGAEKYYNWYKKKIYDEGDWGRSYYQRPIEVEARIEEIASFGKQATRALRGLTHGAGYTKKQVADMVADYKIAKKKYRPGAYRAEAQEFRKR